MSTRSFAYNLLDQETMITLDLRVPVIQRTSSARGNNRTIIIEVESDNDPLLQSLTFTKIGDNLVLQSTLIITQESIHLKITHPPSVKIQTLNATRIFQEKPKS